MATLEILTDEAIVDYTRRGNKNYVLTSHKDFDLGGRYLKPYRRGPYDPEIFGSCYTDRCYCGKIHTFTNEPCPECNARVFRMEDALRKFARIELPFYYLNALRFNIFSDFINELFKDSTIETDFSDTPENLGFNKPGSRRFSQKVYDLCQFEYDPSLKELRITDKITSLEKCSYEGLMDIIENHFPDRLVQYKEFINRFYLVMPAVMRPPALIPQSGSKKPKVGFSKMSIWYVTILTFCCAANRDAGVNNYTKVMNSLKSPREKAAYNALLRSLLIYGNNMATDLLRTSKENLARSNYSIRMKNSLRCPIVPDVDIQIDQVKIPRHLAYEICRDGFIKYIMEKYNFSEEEAKLSTRIEAMNPEMQQEFTDYVEGNEEKGLKGQLVIINRPPSLHKRFVQVKFI